MGGCGGGGGWSSKPSRGLISVSIVSNLVLSFQNGTANEGDGTQVRIQHDKWSEHHSLKEWICTLTCKLIFSLVQPEGCHRMLIPIIMLSEEPMLFHSLGRELSVLRPRRGCLSMPSQKRSLQLASAIMYQCKGETMEHLLLHCDVANILWGTVFRVFGFIECCQNQYQTCDLDGGFGLKVTFQMFGILFCYI